ncbi:MAG: tRNA (cytidine32/uridine32-2'-O)-methyltransferase [Pseudohongiellaceae bacterium]
MNKDPKEVQLASAVRVVLMRTTHPGNIGAVARAMKNMGLNQLCLVNGADESSQEARRRASGAESVLESAVVTSSIDEALDGVQLVIGASARSRKMVWPLMNPRDCASLIVKNVFDSKSLKPTQVALLFGQEASGLSNEELQRCHYHVNIPAVADFSSLNLAMAVQLVCYEIRMAMLLDNTNDAPNILTRSILSSDDAGWDEPPAAVEDVESFFRHLEETLIKIGFHDPEKPRLLMARLRRLYQRAHLDKMEVNILRGILSASQKHTK